MERKFESELAGQVARRHNNPIKGRAKVLFMTMVSCAVMVGAAAAVLSMKASAAEGLPTEYTSVFTGEDYLVNVDGTITYAVTPEIDDGYLVKRTSNLKWTTFDTPGNAPIDYTKVAYTVNVKLNHTIAFTDGVTGMFVSDLIIGGFDAIEPTMVSASISINDAPVVLSLDGSPLVASTYITSVYADGSLSIQVTLPSLDLTSVSYEDGDMVSIFVMFKTPETLLTLDGSEIGFPDYQVPEVL